MPARLPAWAPSTPPLHQVALRVARLPKASGARPRVVVITQGADPTIVACGGKVMHYPVLRVAADEIVDTNGAGDAFVGGFLSQVRGLHASAEWPRGLVSSPERCMHVHSMGMRHGRRGPVRSPVQSLLWLQRVAISAAPAICSGCPF